MDKGLIIFDVGGVLRNSSLALNEGYRRGFASFGMSYGFDALDTWHLRGLARYNGGLECMKALLAFEHSGESIKEVLRNPDAELIIGGLIERHLRADDVEIARKIESIYRKYFHSDEAKKLVTLFPGTDGIMAELKENGYELAIFSNSVKATIERDLMEVDIGRFSMVLSEEDVKRKKPSGEGITTIMKALGMSRKRTFYIGDAVSDVQAAKDAGCISIAVLWGMGTRTQLERAKPDMIFVDLAEARDYFVGRRG